MADYGGERFALAQGFINAAIALVGCHAVETLRDLPMIRQIALLVTMMVGAESPAEIHFDFRGKKFDDKVFKFNGANAAKIITTEDEGLRITLSPEFGAKQNVGISLREWINGDFITTIAYELLQTAPPPKERGLGVSVYLMLDNSNRDGIYFGLLNRGKAGYVFSISHMADGQDGTRINKQFVTVPTDPSSTVGRFRVERTDSVLTLSAGKSNSAVFKQIAELDVGSEDIKMLRVAADPGDGWNFVDVRLTEFIVQTKGLVPGGLATSRAKWYWLTFGGIAGVTTIFFGLRFWRAKKKTQSA